MATTESVLADLDATLDGLCACGCGCELDPAGRSGWWATEECQQTWQYAAVRPGKAMPRAELSPEEIQRIREAMASHLTALSEAMAAWVEQVSRAVNAFAEALRPLGEQMAKAAVIDDAEPTDPRERALWLRRNRNTGPRQDRQWSARRLARESRRSPR